jgi:predicted transcriptional regulator
MVKQSRLAHGNIRRKKTIVNSSINNIRKGKGMSLLELALKADVSLSTIKNVIKGNNTTIEILVLIFRALELNKNDIYKFLILGEENYGNTNE